MNRYRPRDTGRPKRRRALANPKRGGRSIVSVGTKMIRGAAECEYRIRAELAIWQMPRVFRRMAAELRRLDRFFRAADGLAALLGGSRSAGALTPASVATALYRALLDREPDPPGLNNQIEQLRSGADLAQVIRNFIESPEFHSRFLEKLAPSVELPDLRAVMPEKYETQTTARGEVTVYNARISSDIDLMTSMIDRYRFYDKFGVWTPTIDLDKEITAAIVRGLGARSCFELGCFTGPVISLLADNGIEVRGAEVSHLAFAFAYPNIRNSMLFGDILNLQIEQYFDVVLCMDVLEHVNPLRLDDYIEQLAALLNRNGVIYVNSPMWGEDQTFGVFEEPYLDEWQSTADASFWRHWPCDPKGWPLHGHLVWASPGWWAEKFAEHGLARDIPVEQAIHRHLTPFFAQAVGRRCFFVLRRKDAEPAASAVAGIDAALANVPGLQELSRVTVNHADGRPAPA